MAYRSRYDRYDRWPRYVPVAERRANAARELKKQGGGASPVVVTGRQIAESFWGKAWCDNLERYSDFANRLPRGRTYVRNGSVVDLKIEGGWVHARVAGSSLYKVDVKIAPVPLLRWVAVCGDCSGAIDSLVELLQGQFSKAVMARICQETTGLFPSPKEIEFKCSCPDYASMCKHVAAVLYGIGARFDAHPELLFVLRAVDHLELIAQAAKAAPGRKTSVSQKVLATDDLAGMFDIDILDDVQSALPTRRAKASKKAKAIPKSKTKKTATLKETRTRNLAKSLSSTARKKA